MYNCTKILLKIYMYHLLVIGAQYFFLHVFSWRCHFVFFSFIFWKFPGRKTLILCKQRARQFLFALNCCGILCLSGYLAVTIFCHPNSLYPDKAMYKTLWLTCLFVLGIWFQNIIWITGFKFHGPKFKMRWRKVLSTHRCIV